MKRRPEEEALSLTGVQKAAAMEGLRIYLAENHELELSGLQADMLLDYITGRIAPYYYNKAVADALAFMTEKAEDMYLLMRDEPGVR